MPSPEEWKPFLSGELDAIMEKQHAPGASVLLISRDGRLQFEKSVGLACVKPPAPLMLDTPFRAGSISKIVTAIAVQQLVESGRLDLDCRIETLINWDLPYGYGKATTRDLLTHRAGIGERFARQSTPRSGEIGQLNDYLKRCLPPPVAPVGETITYSNFGISLAGLIVEILSGQTFADYAREKIFLPVGMAGAAFVPDPETEAAMARGYNWVFGRDRLLPVRHWRPYPACSLVASARELATLMRSLLLESSPILSTPSRLFEEQYTVVSGVPGMGLTFWLDEVRGQRVAWHTGHMPGHRTGFYLFPDAGIGVVLYYNTDRKVLRSFLDRTASFAFGDTGPVSPVAAPPNSLRSYEGRYRHSWYPHHHFGKTSALLGLEGAEMEVRADGDHLMVDGDRLQQAEDDVFASRVSQKCFGFIRNKRRQITGFYSGGRDRFEKIALLETRLASNCGLAASLFAFALCGALLIGGMLSRESLLPPPLELGFALVCGTNLGFAGAMAILTAQGAYKMTEDLPPIVGLMLTLPIVGAFGWILACGIALAMGSEGYERPIAGFLLIAIVAVSELLFLSYLHYWRLLGWRY